MGYQYGTVADYILETSSIRVSVGRNAANATADTNRAHALPSANRHIHGEECKLLIDSRTTFSDKIKTEINARLLSDSSPKLQLISGEPKFHLEMFMLLDTFKARDQWLVPELLMERDEAEQSTTLFFSVEFSKANPVVHLQDCKRRLSNT
ncbi:MAG: hypothetical protein Q9184_001317 [Pyrenodesmia sp. 2 TL-2023]